MLRDGQVGADGYKPPEGFPAGGFGDQFDAGGSIDDDSDSQTSPSARSSASVSTARTATGTPGRRSKVSNQVARAADRSRSVMPSSMNSSGGSSRSRGRRATRQRYRDSTPHGQVAPTFATRRRSSRDLIGSIEPMDDRPYDLSYDPNEVGPDLVVECWIPNSPRADNATFDPVPGDTVIIGDDEPPLSARVVRRVDNRVWVQVQLPDSSHVVADSPTI